MAESVTVDAATQKVADKLAKQYGVDVGQVVAWVAGYGIPLAKKILAQLGKTPASAGGAVPAHVKSHLEAAEKKAADAYAASVLALHLAK